MGFNKITNVDLSREELEKDITFAGFLTFVNPLKPDTGDNIFTGIEAGF
jgi:magnesium-transporting ATPase (P-type)